MRQGRQASAAPVKTQVASRTRRVSAMPSLTRLAAPIALFMVTTFFVAVAAVMLRFDSSGNGQPFVLSANDGVENFGIQAPVCNGSDCTFSFGQTHNLSSPIFGAAVNRAGDYLVIDEINSPTVRFRIEGEFGNGRSHPREDDERFLMKYWSPALGTLKPDPADHIEIANLPNLNRIGE